MILLELSAKDAQALYDHTGTMPWSPGSWSNNVRSALSEAIGEQAESDSAHPVRDQGGGE